MNGESLLGVRHKTAVAMLKSLHDSVAFLVCDGYDSSTEVSQSGQATVTDQGHELLALGGKMVTEQGEGHRGQAVQGDAPVSDVRRSQGLVFQAQETIQERVSRVHSPVDRDQREMPSDKVSQGQGLEPQIHDPVTEKVKDNEVVFEKVSRGHALVSEGHEVASDCQDGELVFVARETMSNSNEPTAAEQWRERARQRRQARYGITCFAMSTKNLFVL